ncbi:MAG: hypothetical protein VKO39_12730 [Cyanobacteriota bacterium]|nr:hypothetical protein [Cyanobacteriota bacterium]
MLFAHAVPGTRKKLWLKHYITPGTAMIRRIVYITTVQIVIYAIGFPMLIAYELGASRLNSAHMNPATSALPVEQRAGVFSAEPLTR